MQMYDNLTHRQRDILEFLRNYYMNHDTPLTIEKLCQETGMKSRGSMHRHLKALVSAGLVEAANRKQRGIRLTAPVSSDHGSGIPLLGYIAAGSPIEAIENPVDIEIPTLLTGKGSCYVLQVKGDSMIEDGILDGDWVVIEQRKYARNGEIVVALIDGQDATLKHIEQKPGEIVLHPANPDLQALHFRVEQVEIQGVLVGQMRSYHSSTT